MSTEVLGARAAWRGQQHHLHRLHREDRAHRWRLDGATLTICDARALPKTPRLWKEASTYLSRLNQFR